MDLAPPHPFPSPAMALVSEKTFLAGEGGIPIKN